MTGPGILLLGGDGQVGWELSRALAPLGGVVAPTPNEVDLADLDHLRTAVRTIAPTIVVNAAAYTAVDKAENEVAQAMRINADAVAVMAQEARALGSLLVHYSTDYVFDGSKAIPYVESDAVAPLGAYGRSKAAGEKAIVEAGTDALVFRTSWVFGAHGNNFVKTIFRLAAERDALRVVADQVGSPTPAALIADITAHALLAWRRGALTGGIYHLAAADPVSWHAFAVAIVEAAQSSGRPLRLRPAAIVAIATSEFPLPAKRPANSRLDCRRLEQALNLSMPNWRPYLQRMLEFT